MLPSKRIGTTLLCAGVLTYACYILFFRTSASSLFFSYKWCQDHDVSDRVTSFPVSVEEAFIRQRLERSEEIWARSVVTRREAMKTAKLPDGYYNRGVSLFFWDFFYATFDCPHFIERVGKVGDGGKWICGFDKITQAEPGTDKSCIVYSFGISSEITFEEEILKRTDENSGKVPCTIHMYDPTIDIKKKGSKPGGLVAKYGDRAKFNQLGISNKTDDTMRTLNAAMAANGDDWMDILKVDVEGHEFESFLQMVEEFGPGNLPFGQLQLEIHAFSMKVKRPELPKRFGEWFKMLEDAGLRAFHREGNFIPNLNNKRADISTFEYSFVNVKNERNKLLHA